MLVFVLVVLMLVPRIHKYSLVHQLPHISSPAAVVAVVVVVVVVLVVLVVVVLAVVNLLAVSEV